MPRCVKCAAECSPHDLTCTCCGAHLPRPMPFLPVMEMAAIAVVAPWLWYGGVFGPLLLIQAVAPDLLKVAPVWAVSVAYLYGWLLPVAILAAVGAYGYRRRTLGRITSAVLGWLLGGLLQLAICIALSPLAPEQWKLAFGFVFGMAYAAVALTVAAVSSSVAVGKSRTRDQREDI